MTSPIQTYAFGGQIYPAPLLQSVGSQISTELPKNTSIILYFDTTLSAALANYLLQFTTAGPTTVAAQLANGSWLQNIPVSLHVIGALGSPITVFMTVTQRTLLASPDFPAMLY